MSNSSNFSINSLYLVSPLRIPVSISIAAEFKESNYEASLIPRAAIIHIIPRLQISLFVKSIIFPSEC